MPHYRIQLDADLIVKANDRDVVANRVRRMFKDARLDPADIEWSIKAIKPAEARALAEIKKGGTDTCPTT